MFFRTVLFVIVVACIDSSVSSQDRRGTQQEKQKTVEFVREYGHSTVVIQSRNQFIKHTSALLDDIGYGTFKEMAANVIREKQAGEMDSDRPIIVYRLVGGTSLTETTIKDESAVRARPISGLRPKLSDWKEPQKIDFPPVHSDLLWGTPREGKTYGVVSGKQFVAGKSKKSLTDWRNSKPLKSKLLQRTQDVINNSGFSYIESFNKNHDPFDFFSELDEVKYEGDEKTVAGQINALGKAVQFLVLGTTYENKSLEFRAHIQFKKNDVIGKLVDLDKVKQPFQSTIGLPRDGLVASVSANLESLRSPSTVRVMSQKLAAIVEQMFGRRKAKLDRATISIAGELIAESWHEIAAIRTGLYIADEEKNTESMAVIAVIDPRNPDGFIDELTKIMTLVDSSEKTDDKQLRESELKKWIANLDSKSYETRKRATTRLMLAGGKAEPYLRKVMNSGSPEQRMRIRMVLKQLETNSKQAAKILASNDGQIWSKIQPAYSLKKNAGKMGNHTYHEIRISVGNEFNEKTKVRYEQEMRAVFGLQWSTIRLVRVNRQFVLMLGSSDELLKTAVANVAAKKNPIRKTFEKNKRRLAGNNQLEVNFSAPRIVNLLNFDKPEVYVKPDDQNISSIGLNIGDQTWESTFHVPASELKVWLNQGMR